jgi:hypothetical protein
LRNAAICSRVTVAAGQYVVAEQPLVIPAPATLLMFV